LPPVLPPYYATFKTPHLTKAAAPPAVLAAYSSSKHRLLARPLPCKYNFFKYKVFKQLVDGQDH
jgi:hypothetical protein